MEGGRKEKENGRGQSTLFCCFDFLLENSKLLLKKNSVINHIPTFHFNSYQHMNNLVSSLFSLTPMFHSAMRLF